MKCLIVEDDFVGRKLMQKYLSDYGECDVAVDGEEAVDAFRLAMENELPYDLICLDIMMPNMNGHEALNAIRRIENQHGINGLDGVKVIMTTALGDSENVMGSFREGCEAYIVKPVRKDVLLREIEKLGLSLTASR
jgi:two-component system, chemotaxis family, chemotaxis protein CheY